MNELDKSLWIAAVLIGLAVAALVFAVVSRLTALLSSRDAAEKQTDSRDSLLIALVHPFALALEQNPKYAAERRKYNDMLEISGPFWGGMTSSEVLASKYVLPFFGIFWGLCIGLILSLPFLITLFLMLLAALLLCKMPESSLAGQVEQQKKLFLKQLPGALDLLLISVKSGMDLRGSIFYLARNYVEGPVKREFHKVELRISLGGSLSDSLEDMADRLNLPVYSSLAVSLTQALETGTSIANILQLATGDIRKQRLLQAKTDAQTAAVKIAFPMLLLIIPGVFIVLLGPVAIRLMTQLFTQI